MAKKKKKELFSTSWFSGPILFVATHSSLTLPGTPLASSVPRALPYGADPYMFRQVFNIPAYIVYGTLLPTPLEQIAFAKDPLGIVPPYEWKGGFHAILDVAATVGDPFGVARSQLQSPHEAAFGRPNQNYWSSPEGQAVTELLQASGY